jgi:hypothetical protein
MNVGFISTNGTPTSVDDRVKFLEGAVKKLTNLFINHTHHPAGGGVLFFPDAIEEEERPLGGISADHTSSN